MLQLWLRCGLISGSMLFGWAGMFWVGISGTTFRNSLGRLLCRLRLLWGESPFNFCICICYFCGSGFFLILLLLYVGWFGFMVLLWWVVFITMVSVVLMLAGLLHVHDNCFHQIGMIAFIKLRHPLSFCRNCVICVCLSCFQVKMKIIMVLTQLVWILLYLTIGVWRIFILLLYFALFLLVACFRLDEKFA